MVGLEIRIAIEPEKRSEFLQAAESLLDDHSLPSGCTDRGIYEQHGVPNEFLWHEEWNDQASLEGRLESREFHALLGALKVLGREHDIRIASIERRSRTDQSERIG